MSNHKPIYLCIYFICVVCPLHTESIEWPWTWISFNNNSLADLRWWCIMYKRADFYTRENRFVFFLLELQSSYLLTWDLIVRTVLSTAHLARELLTVIEQHFIIFSQIVTVFDFQQKIATRIKLPVDTIEYGTIQDLKLIYRSLKAFQRRVLFRLRNEDP